MVDKEGYIVDSKVTRSVDPVLDKGALRVVNSMPKWENVNPGGKLILTNAHASNPTRLWMEYVSEWYLLYKTKDEMYQIIDGLQSLDNVEYIMDEFSVYQYMILTKN